jgi:30S ribosomal protein S31
MHDALFLFMAVQVAISFYLAAQLKHNIIMGRGDAKTKKGKTFKGSFGKSRPARPAKKAAPKKEA